MSLPFCSRILRDQPSAGDQYPAAMSRALERHDELLRHALESHDGYVFKTVGDAFYAVFWSPGNALRAAIAAQLAIYTEDWAPGNPDFPSLEHSGGPAYGPGFGARWRLFWSSGQSSGASGGGRQRRPDPPFARDQRLDPRRRLAGGLHAARPGRIQAERSPSFGADFPGKSRCIARHQALLANSG